MHIPVLLHQSIEGLGLEKGDIFCDATINGGGHSAEVAKRFHKDVRIVGIDLDQDALERAAKRLEECGADFILIESSFRKISEVLDEKGIPVVNKIIFDLGLSSNQFDISGRGFSFQNDEPLLMTFKKNPSLSDVTAQRIVNEWDEENIADIIYGYGEEKYSRRIAKKIVESRKNKPINTTFELVEIIKSAVPYFYQRGKLHFATRTFQALRIATNDEIGALKEGIDGGFKKLARGGRMAVISFHSIEDRIVKRFFIEKKEQGQAILINKKPITPTIEEVKENRRSRSAKLRILEKL